MATGGQLSYNIEFEEPAFDTDCNQWLLVGSLRLEIEGEHYRTLSVKHWLSHEARFNQRWFNLAKEDIRRELEDRANRETRSILQYRQPAQAEFTRITIPLARRVYPQLIANNIVSMRGPSPLAEIYANWRHAENTGGGGRRYRMMEPREKINWKKEGF